MRKRTILAALAVLTLLAWPWRSLAQQTIPGLQEIGADTDCFACHSSRDLNKDIPGQKRYSLYIDKSHWRRSAHAQIGCGACHGDHPHPPADQVSTPGSWRKFETEMRETCAGCHAEESKAFSASVHAQSDNPSAPSSCVGCHDPHEAGLTTRTKKGAVRICGGCHPLSRRTYYLSVHGQNLALGNEKVAACFNCHGYHNVKRVKEAFTGSRLSRVCSQCHKGVPRNVSGWYSHTPVTRVQGLILSSTELFYIIIIPLTLLSMIAHQLLKHRRTMEERRQTRQEEE